MTKARTGAKKKTYYRILSIDGGGIRGLIPATVLVELEAMIRAKRGDNGCIGDYFDFIAGTSTGGILTCLYLYPDDKDKTKAKFSAADARDLYLRNGDTIFDRSLWQQVSTVGGFTDAKYDPAALERVLKNYVKDTPLSALIKPCLVTGYDVNLYCPVFFTQQDADRAENNYLVRHVARATSAAPTYFPPALPESLDDIPNATPVIDGGVFANNPTACAFVEALAKGRKNGGNFEAVPADEIVVLSLGTGGVTDSLTYNQCKDWGPAGWLRPLLGILMDGVSQTVDFQMRTLYAKVMGLDVDKGEGYLRINGNFTDYQHHLLIQELDHAMDCATKKNMSLLCNFGKQLALNFNAQLDAFVQRYF